MYMYTFFFKKKKIFPEDTLPICYSVLRNNMVTTKGIIWKCSNYEHDSTDKSTKTKQWVNNKSEQWKSYQQAN